MVITNKDQNKKNHKTKKRHFTSKQSRRIGVAEGKIPDLDLDKFNSINVDEDFYGKDDNKKED